MLVGYARVSTLDQDTTMQRDALERAGVQRLFADSSSGVGPRPQLQEALTSLVQGDTLIVWKLDRIARSLHDLLAIERRLKSVGAGIRSLTEPLDTSSPFGEFTFQVLGAVAQLERSMIRERIMAGLRRTTKKSGRRPMPDHRVEAIRTSLKDGLGLRATARLHRASPMTVTAIKRSMETVEEVRQDSVAV